jgi:hypothetical protein
MRPLTGLIYLEYRAEGQMQPKIVSELPTVKESLGKDETYFGSKLVQALAEYSGRFRSEFGLTETENESYTK